MWRQMGTKVQMFCAFRRKEYIQKGFLILDVHSIHAPIRTGLFPMSSVMVGRYFLEITRLV